MTLETGIYIYEKLAYNFSRSAASKEFYNKEAAEDDRKTAYEYRQVADWLKELKQFRESAIPKAKIEEVIEKLEKQKGVHVTPLGTPIEVVPVMKVKGILKEACDG